MIVGVDRGQRILKWEVGMRKSEKGKKGIEKAEARTCMW
jgi:hypothetical protein